MKPEIQKCGRTCRALLLLATKIALTGIATQAHAQGNLVFNGGFDTDASGWTGGNLGLSAGYRPDKGNPGGFFVLDNANPSSSTDPIISQMITGLEFGNTYVISGSYQYGIDRGGGSPTAPSFGVAIDGVSFFTTPMPSLIDRPNWLNFSFFYAATSSTVTLSLSAQMNGTGVSYGIDNIVMSAVPEPSSFALLICGSSAWLFFRRFLNSTRQP